MSLVVSNFKGEKKNDPTVAWVKPADDFKKSFKGLHRGVDPAFLLWVLDNSAAVRSVCDTAIAQANAANSAQSAPSAPPVAQYYATTGDGNTIGPFSKMGAIEFCTANDSNPTAMVHFNGQWHTKDKWASLGLVAPSAPPAPVAPPAPTAPAAPSVSAAPMAPANGQPRGLAALIGTSKK